jgi:hypothetical protein
MSTYDLSCFASPRNSSGEEGYSIAAHSESQSHMLSSEIQCETHKMDIKDINAFGWSGMGQRILFEGQQGVQNEQAAPTSRFIKTWREIKDMSIMDKLVQLAVSQMQLLHAVDTFPRGEADSPTGHGLLAFRAALMHANSTRCHFQSSCCCIQYRICRAWTCSAAWHVHTQPGIIPACAPSPVRSSLSPTVEGQLFQIISTKNAATPAGGLCQGGALKEALRRYERLWLPLIAAQAGSGSNGQQQQQQQGYRQLVPPLDVAFLWHLHRLQPGLYEEDCQQLKGRDGKSLQGALHVTPQQVGAWMLIAAVHQELSWS